MAFYLDLKLTLINISDQITFYVLWGRSNI